MTSREARLGSPKLLPGVSAAAWSRVQIWLWIISIALFIAGFTFEFVPPLAHILPFAGFVLIVPSIVITLGLRLGSLTGLPQEKAEVRAGYTTLPRKYANLEQLDPATGAVIRAAGAEYLPRRRRDQNRDPVSTTTSLQRPSILKRIGPQLIGFVASAVFAVVVYSRFGLLSNGRLTILVVLFCAINALYALAILAGSLRVRRMLLTLRAAAPTEFALIFGTARGLVPALQALVPVDDVADPDLTRARQATASHSGISFWQGKTPHVVAQLPWSKVISIQQDTVRVGRSTNPSVAITFRDDEAGEVVALPLMNAEANYLVLHSTAETRWIAWELNQLRTSQTSARLI